MFNLFKKTTTSSVNVNEVIEEIHETFYTEVDKLLADAKIANSLDTNKQDLIDKCERLKNLGFINTKEVKDAEIEIKRLDNLKQDNESKKHLIEAIEYFSSKYPQYKFITEDSVKKICKKYNLVYGVIENYIGTVPDVNLKHIENFRIDKEDECYVHECKNNNKLYKREYHSIKTFNFKAKSYEREWDWTTINMKCSLEIVAPIKDFNMKNKEVKDFQVSKVEIPDPIVLQPVIYNDMKFFLIVTCWGLEASDELIVNENHN